MRRDDLVRMGVLALVGLLAWWIVSVTEWAEVDVPTPARGEAARNRLFATELLMRRLGAQVEHRSTLDTLPPPGARLLLDSRQWTLFPERGERLRQWVEGGGHLVVPAWLLDEDEVEDWMPIETGTEAPRPPRPDRPPPARGAGPEPGRLCRELRAPGEAGAAMRACTPRFWRAIVPAEGVQPLWELRGERGVEVLRVPLGRGSVTALGSGDLLNNREVLRRESDHALIAAHALQVEPGATVWVVLEEAREPLLRWAWQHGWIALLLVLAAVLAGLWRSAVRFGPIGVVPPPERRSMKEQVAGTGAFLQHHGSTALHAAQVRALHEAARQRLPGYARLDPAAAAQAIARATGLPPGDLERAMQPHPRPPNALPHTLELLELARRRLAWPESTHHP